MSSRVPPWHPRFQDEWIPQPKVREQLMRIFTVTICWACYKKKYWAADNPGFIFNEFKKCTSCQQREYCAEIPSKHIFKPINMLQIIEQTHEEKMKMYCDLPKEKLAEMLIECNRIIDMWHGAGPDIGLLRNLRDDVQKVAEMLKDDKGTEGLFSFIDRHKVGANDSDGYKAFAPRPEQPITNTTQRVPEQEHARGEARGQRIEWDMPRREHRCHTVSHFVDKKLNFLQIMAYDNRIKLSVMMHNEDNMLEPMLLYFTNDQLLHIARILTHLATPVV